jgi:flagellar motor switch protein FliM
VTLRSTRLSPDDLGTLAVGDVVRLSHPAAAPLDVTVDDVVFAHATPGVRGKRLAAQIVAVPTPAAPGPHKETR